MGAVGQIKGLPLRFAESDCSAAYGLVSCRLARFSFANHAHFLRRPHLRYFQRPFATRCWNFTGSFSVRAAFAKWG